MASPVGDCSPVIKLVLIASPVVASYLPTVPLWFATKRVLSNNVSAVGRPAPVMKLALIASPVVASYLPTVLEPEFATKRVLPWAASPLGALNCVIKLALMAAPVVALYSRTGPVASNTKSLLPDNASAVGRPAPVMKLALIALPVWRCICQQCRSRSSQQRGVALDGESFGRDQSLDQVGVNRHSCGGIVFTRG